MRCMPVIASAAARPRDFGYACPQTWTGSHTTVPRCRRRARPFVEAGVSVADGLGARKHQ